MVRRPAFALLLWLPTAAALSAWERAVDWEPLQDRMETLLRLGQIADATALLESAIATERRRGEMGPEAAGALSDLGAAYYDLGRYGEAERALKESISLLERFPDAGSKAGIALMNMAVLRTMQGRTSEAGNLYLAAERTFREARDTPNLGLALCGLADLYLSTGRVNEVRPAAARAVAALERAREAPELGVALFIAAKIASLDKRDAEAERLRRRALEIWEQSPGRHSLTYVSGLTDLAISLSRRKPVESSALFRESLDLIGQIRDSGHVAAGFTRIAYAKHLQSIGSKGEARRMKRRGQQILSAHSRQNQLGHTVDIQAFQRLGRQ